MAGPLKALTNAGSSVGVDAPAVEITELFWPEHEALFRDLRDEVDWEKSMSARLTASFGEPYNYRQMVYPRCAMHPRLSPVRDALEERLGVPFNNCLLNYYLDGRSKMGFHADDTSELVAGSGVAIVTLGSARPLTFRRQDDPDVRTSFLLQPGSLLFMRNEVQDEWVHAIKRRRHAEPRISLTWRAFARSAAS